MGLLDSFRNLVSGSQPDATVDEESPKSAALRMVAGDEAITGGGKTKTRDVYKTRHKVNKKRRKVVLGDSES